VSIGERRLVEHIGIVQVFPNGYGKILLWKKYPCGVDFFRNAAAGLANETLQMVKDPDSSGA
jgi:hypothetical protein